MIITKEIEVPNIVYEKDNIRLEIYREQEPMNPREWDNRGIMKCAHKRYNLGDEQIESSQFKGWDEIEKYLYNEEEAIVVLPLYLYDHSGITISTTPFHCPWDSGQVGFIYTNKDQIKKMGCEHKTKEEIIQTLKNEVDTYDKYLTGDVWRYHLRDNNNDEEDSCGGFFSINDILTETGMEDAEEVVE